MTMTNAYKEGQQAAKDGKDLLDNPYQSGADYEEWLDGFLLWVIENDCVMSA